MVFDFKLPDLGEGIHEAEVLGVKIFEGQTISEDQILFEVETDKAVVEIPSPVSGKVAKILVKTGQIVTVGSIMISIDQNGQSKEITQTQNHNESKSQPSGISNSNQSSNSLPDTVGVIASPATRQLARELKIDLHKVTGSGPGGKITKEDLLAYSNKDQSVKTDSTIRNSSTAIGIKLAESALPDFAKFGPIERIPIRSLRRKTAQLMVLSWAKIPHVTHCDEANITELDKFRQRHQDEVKSKGAKLTLTAFVMKAASIALQQFPDFNTSYDESTDEIIFKRYYNLGMAVATDRGLIVPVIKSVDQKSIFALALEIAEVAERARAAKSELSELQGATFTITNIGAIGGTSATPIIHYPESAILAVMKMQERAIVNNGKIESALIMPLCLAFDHRLTDGAEAARFSRLIIKMLEDPQSFEKYL